MSSLLPHQASIDHGVLLDGRLALFQEREQWLAVADIHFGYELSQRAAGRLVPLWGMDSIEKRLLQLLHDYRPERLVLLGDLVHDETAIEQFRALLEELRNHCEPILIGGNHDRKLGRKIALLSDWKTDGFHFHHGHCTAEPSNRIQIIGHHHPAGTVIDGAGLRLKLPAFVQTARCWIMPAFSPWAAGASFREDPDDRMWLCTPKRVLRLAPRAAVSPNEKVRPPAPRCNAGSASP